MAEDVPTSIGNTLRNLRIHANLSGVQAAELAGLSQPTISRYERGKVVPSINEAHELLLVYRADEETQRKVMRLLKQWQDEATVPARIVMHRGAGELQRRIGKLEMNARRICTFSPLVVPGLLQLREYAAAVFASGGDMALAEQARALDARMERRGLLDDERHEFVMLLPDGVLSWQVKSPRLMADQLDHVIEVSRKPNVRLGVIPWTTPVDVAPMHGFDVYDEAGAVVGTESATAFLTDPFDIGMYVKLFADLEALATFDAGAELIIAERAARFRTVSYSP